MACCEGLRNTMYIFSGTSRPFDLHEFDYVTGESKSVQKVDHTYQMMKIDDRLIVATLELNIYSMRDFVAKFTSKPSTHWKGAFAEVSTGVLAYNAYHSESSSDSKRNLELWDVYTGKLLKSLNTYDASYILRCFLFNK